MGPNDVGGKCEQALVSLMKYLGLQWLLQMLNNWDLSSGISDSLNTAAHYWDALDLIQDGTVSASTPPPVSRHDFQNAGQFQGSMSSNFLKLKIS